MQEQSCPACFLTCPDLQAPAPHSFLFPSFCPGKVLWPFALCCASQVSDGRGVQICFVSSAAHAEPSCWEISPFPCISVLKEFIVTSLPSSTWTGNIGFQVGAGWDGNQDFSSKVSVLPSISTKQLLFCHLDDLREPTEVADFTHRAAGVGPYLWPFQ